MNNYEKRAKWFADRIGKRVYRNSVTCKCAVCKGVSNHGLIIADKLHASYLHDVESEFTAEGNPTRYFDTEEEAKEFENSLNRSENE